MRILIVNSHRSIVGGTERYLEGLLPALAQRGHEVSFLYQHDAGSQEGRVDAAITPANCWQFTDEKSRSVLEAVGLWGPQIVFVHALRNTPLENQLLNEYRSYLFAHDHCRTCPAGAKTFSFPVLAPCARTAGLGCLATHYPRRCGGLSPMTAWNDFTRWQKMRDLAIRYSGVFTASHRMADDLVQQGVDRERIVIAAPPSPGVEPLGCAPAARPFTNRIVFIGRLQGVKGADILLQAMRPAEVRLGRKLELLVAGDGPDRSALEDLAQRLGVGARFLGWIGTEERNRLLRDADLLAMPSVWPEPYGLSGCEAGAVGTPAVAFPVGGIPEWLKTGVTGEAASGGLTPDSLAWAMVRALGDPAHHQNLREGAWRFALNQNFAEHTAVLEQTWRMLASEPLQ